LSPTTLIIVACGAFATNSRLFLEINPCLEGFLKRAGNELTGGCLSDSLELSAPTPAKTFDPIERSDPMAMQLTRAGEYAIKSLLYLAAQGADSRIMASDVASAQQIPVNFVRKILESLAKTGLVKSYRGAGGGFTLGRAPEQISVRNIIEAVEGPLALNQCLLPIPCESIADCPMCHVWREAQQAVEKVLDGYSLADVVGNHGSK